MMSKVSASARVFFCGVALILGFAPSSWVAAAADTNETSPPTAPDIVISERERCGEIIDMHLHLAPWFQTVDDLLNELDGALVDRGILYAVYPPLTFPGTRDANEQVSEMALGSDGRIVGLASCNTTHSDWNATRDAELQRLAEYLDRPEFVGGKLAPPHTCLRLDGERIADVVRTISASTTPVLAIHVGTTPFCGPIGAAVGLEACCSREYVAPSLLTGLIEEYPETTFILLHAGHDFLPAGDVNYYNGTLVDESIQLAQDYPNVYLEISAMHAETVPDEEDDFKYPGGQEEIRRMVEAGVVDKIIWASDGNHIQGALVEVMKESFEDMIAAGMTDKERCMSLSGRSRMIFGMDDDAAGTTDGNPPSSTPIPAPTPTTSAAAGSLTSDVLAIQLSRFAFAAVATAGILFWS